MKATQLPVRDLAAYFPAWKERILDLIGLIGPIILATQKENLYLPLSAGREKSPTGHR